MTAQVNAGGRRLDACLLFVGAIDDAGAGTFLWWYGASEKYAIHANVDLYLDGPDRCPMGSLRLFPCLRASCKMIILTGLAECPAVFLPVVRQTGVPGYYLSVFSQTFRIDGRIPPAVQSIFAL